MEKSLVGAKVCLYAASSSVLLVLNKISITAVPNATLLLFVQLLSTALFIILPGLFGVVEVNMFPSKSTVNAYLSVATVFLATIYSNFQVIHSIGVNSFIVLRCGTPLLIAYLDWIFLGREFPRGTSLLPLFGIFICASAYSFLKLSEHSSVEAPPQGRSSLVAGLWSLVWFSSFILDMVYIKYVVHAYPCLPSSVAFHRSNPTTANRRRKISSYFPCMLSSAFCEVSSTCRERKIQSNLVDVVASCVLFGACL